jgi:hypothetical protein
MARLQQGFAAGEMGFRVSLHDSNPKLPMSALGQKQTWMHVRVMSALPPKADMDQHGRDVRFVPKADIVNAAAVSAKSRNRTCQNGTLPRTCHALQVAGTKKAPARFGRRRG